MVKHTQAIRRLLPLFDHLWSWRLKGYYQGRTLSVKVSSLGFLSSFLKKSILSLFPIIVQRNTTSLWKILKLSCIFQRTGSVVSFTIYSDVTNINDQFSPSYRNQSIDLLFKKSTTEVKPTPLVCNFQDMCISRSINGWYCNDAKIRDVFGTKRFLVKLLQTGPCFVNHT